VVLSAVIGLLSLSLPSDSTRVRLVPIDADELIAVREWGQGEPVIIVPGLLGSAFGFRKVVPELVANGHRVIIIDPLGTGSSTAPERADYSLTAQAARIAAVADTLGITQAVFVCHAIGASICYRLALARPAMVTHIISVNGGPAERMATAGLGLALRVAPLLKLFGAEGIVKGKVRDGLKKSSADSLWVTDEVVAGYTAHYRDGLGPVIRTLKRMSSASEPDSLRHRLPEIQTPVTLLLGCDAKTAPLHEVEIDALRALPMLTIDSVEGAGQYIQEEQPGAIVDAIAGRASAGTSNFRLPSIRRRL
jgi:pimeloyl-ACP methyl ester carboxylesterase